MDYSKINNIRELRETTGLSQSKFAEHFSIPVRSLQEWEQERREPPTYLLTLMIKILELEGDKPSGKE